MTVSDVWCRIAWQCRRLCLGSLVLLAALPALADDALPERVSFVGDIWCPYNCAEQDARRGALVDMLAAILAKRGIALDYRVLPWTRALQEVSEGRIDGIIGAGESDAKFALLTRKPWLHAELAALTHRDTDFRWQGLTSLTGKSVVVIANYEYAAPLPAWLAAHPDTVHQLSGDNAFRQAVLLIQHKRQQVFFSSYPALRRHLQANQLNDTLVIHKTGLKTPIYMGVAKTKSYSETLLALLNQGFDELNASGKTNAIIASYDF
ncbi:transporter substrate-binding domain-containing protein [Permianibacter sp. IMCC34836]|uniref:substrate-binding periplasmic protein n=1 Tax=Permianibacter fluminis TaxID=2738515 RepID=UPI0015582055|nr:transporter substrate-binding domain-containing protein [Permianibacter fluminis]NQD35875.1 transporter substrate-binding domain-containing protein [Permianibacter fluminis]